MPTETRKRKKQRLDAMRILPQVIGHMLAMSDTDLLPGMVCELINEHLKADQVALFLVDAEGRYVVEHEVVGPRLKATPHRLRIREEGIVGWVAAHRLPQIVADVHRDKRYIKSMEAVRSEAALPITAGDRLLGVLNLESKHPGYFRKSDLPLLQFLAAQIAVALRMGELDRRLLLWQERMGAVGNLARLGGGVVPLDKMLQRGADSVRMTCGGHYAAIFQADYDREEIVLVADSSATPISTKIGQRIPFGKGLVGKAFSIGEVLNVRDVRRDSMHLPVVPGVLSEICVPIRVGNNQVGILNAQAAMVDAFSMDEAAFLETVARFLAPALRTKAKTS